MKHSDLSQRIRIGSNYAQLAGSFLIGLVVVRILLGLGESVYGVVALLIAGTSLARLLREVLQVGLVPKLGAAWNGDNVGDEFPRVYSSSIFVAAGCAVLTLIGFAILDQLLGLFDIPESLREAASAFVWLRGLQSAVAILAGPTLTMLLVREKFVAHNVVIFAERTLDLVAAIVTLVAIGSDDPARAIVTYALIVCLGSIVLHAGTAIALMNRSRRLRPEFNQASRVECRGVASSLGWNAVHAIAMNLHLRLDVLIMNGVFGLIPGMLFSIAGQAASYVRQCAMGLVWGVDALSARHWRNKEANDLRTLLRNQMAMQASAIFLAAGFLLIGAEALIEFWLFRRLDNPAESIPEIALYCRILIIGVVARSFSESWISALTGTGNARKFAPLVLAGALLNPVLIFAGIALVAEPANRLIPAICFSSIFVIVHLFLIPRVAAKTLEVEFVDLFRPARIPAIAAILGSLPALALWALEVGGPALPACTFGVAFVISLRMLERVQGAGERAPVKIEKRTMAFGLPTAPPHRIAMIATAACVLAATLASAAVLVDARFLFLATGLWAATILLIPVVATGRAEPFSMWSFVALTVLIGITLRGACLTFGFPNADRLDHLFFLGREPAFFFVPAGWLLLGLLMLAIGYVAIPFPAKPIRLRPVRESRALALGLVLLVVSTTATVLYISKTGGFASGEWSAKRTVIPDLDLKGSGYQSFGGLRFLASLALFGHLLILPLALTSSIRRNRILLWVLALTLLAVACFVPFYASLRTTVAMNLLMFAAMLHFAGRPKHRVILIGAAAVMLLAVYMMTALRPSSPDRETQLKTPTITRIFEAAVINRNQIDLPKTAHILEAVPEKLPFQYGKTIARWVLAPIPRSLWPDKPVIPPGPEIGRTVYGQNVAGVPPSLVAELFWNFQLPGVVIGAFGFGVLLRFLQSRFSPGDCPWAAALFVAGPMTLGFEAIGSSIGSGLFRAALHSAVMLAFLMLIQQRKRGKLDVTEMHLLHAVETLSRRAGGLSVAVGGLTQALAELDDTTSIEIFAGSPPDPISISESVRMVRMPSGSYQAGRHIDPIHRSRPISVLHQHGLWAPLTVGAGRFARRKKIPLVISPHGMLEPWALNHHAIRKKIAWRLYQHRNLKSAAVLHATSESEARRFRDLGLTAPIAIISLGLNPPPESPRDPAAVDAPKGRKQLLFLSRIHPKKGIDRLLEAWAAIEAPDWELVITGNDEGNHQAPLERRVHQLNLGDRVRFTGPLFGPDKDTAFRRADLFVLPSHSENFGFVVPEALQYGLPVITTTGTPWDKLPAEDCGWWIEAKVAPLSNALKEATGLSDEERAAMGKNGRALVERDHRWPELGKRFLDVYRWLAGAGERPDDLWLD